MPQGGKRPGSGRKRKIIDEAAPLTKNAASEILEALNHPAKPDESYEIQKWRMLSEALDTRIRLDTRKYLYDKRDGKPVQTVNHLHDKPIEMTVSLSMSEIVREVRRRKEEYERSRA